MFKSQSMKRIVILLVALSASEVLAEEIVLRPAAVPASAVVRLGDIAEIRGADAAQAERLARLPLMPAPAPGATRFVRARQIEDMLAALGEDVQRIQFTGTAQVALQSPPAAAPAPFASAVGEAASLARLPEPQTDGRAARQMALAQGRVSGVDLPPNARGNDSPLNQSIQKLIRDQLSVQSGNIDGWQINFNLSDRQQSLLSAATSPLVCDGGRAPWTGQQQFTLSFATADGPLRLGVSAEVRLPQPVIVAQRAIPRGALITAADVALQHVEQPPVASQRRAPIATVEELIGMESTRAIQAGEVISSDQVRAPLLVKRGDAVTVVSQGGGIRVRTTAKATQEGARGDLVQVESLETKEKYDARVTGLREVSVLTPSQTGLDPAAQAAASAPAAFRRYRPASATPRDNNTRETTAFRKYLNEGGPSNAQIR